MSSRCVGGGLQFRTGSSPVRYPGLCGENGRYSPPVVMFGEEGEEGEVVISVVEPTPRTQWLLHYSFTTTRQMTGSTRLAGKGN